MITFENVSKSFSSQTVLKNINLTIKEGETFCLLGHSGSGKTTLLKLINKLIVSDNGSIFFNNQDINTIDVRNLRKNIGYVIQSGGLFPHMNIAKNIALPLKLSGAEESIIRPRTEELINQIGLDKSFLNRYPTTLSGGQQQRVGIARAIANHPDLLLLDEPFSALDPVLRDQMQNDFLELQAIKDITKVMVTHDLKEALKLGDRICLMGKGEIQFTGTPTEFLQSDLVTVKDYIGDEKVSLFINGLTLGQIKNEIRPVANTEDGKDIFKATDQTPLTKILNQEKPFVLLADNDHIYEVSQIKKVFFNQLSAFL
ncbi:MAG: ABC transporter ATP-binding protein [Bacteroidota bacterium]